MTRKGYAIVLLDVTDASGYGEYARAATEIEARYGGRPLVVADVPGVTAEVVDGTWPAERVAVIEFPSLEHARDWYADPAYRELIPMRHEATVSNVLLVEGIPPG